MTDLVVDASVVIKWVLPEADSAPALTPRSRRLAAPDLLTAECVNILWKHVRRGERSLAEAQAAAGLLGAAGIELRPMRGLADSATQWAVRLDHPAYDCFYLALAELLAVPLVTVDGRLQRRLRVAPTSAVRILGLDAL
jgi:predicted nucleic acid-binding protein